MSNKAMADSGDEELGMASRAQTRWFSGTESLQLMLEHLYLWWEAPGNLTTSDTAGCCRSMLYIPSLVRS